MFEVKSAGWPPAGRSGGWRFGMIWTGLLIGGLGVLIIVFPELIAYALGGVLIVVGLTIVGAALRFPSSPPGPQARWPQDGGPQDGGPQDGGPRDADFTVVVETIEETD